MKIKTRETREGKVKQIGLPVVDYIKSYRNAVSNTKSMDEPKMSRKVIFFFNMAWEQACHTLINLKYIFNLGKLKKKMMSLLNP